MNKVTIIVVSLILALVLGLGGCIPVNPPAAPATESPVPPPVRVTTGVPPPEVPQEVLLLWKSEPASKGSTADVEDKITLQPNLATGTKEVSEDISLGVIPKGSWQNSTSFYLKEGQWVDVIVSSLDVPVYYLTEEPGAASLKVARWAEYEGKKVRSMFGQDMGPFSPFYGKLLYQNRVANTEKGTIFTTAARVFAWGGPGEYWFIFYNFSRQKEAQITCHVYKLGTTPGWGEEYKNTQLQPWLNELYYMLVSGTLTEEEYDRAESQWLKQFE